MSRRTKVLYLSFLVAFGIVFSGFVVQAACVEVYNQNPRLISSYDKNQDQMIDNEERDQVLLDWPEKISNEQLLSLLTFWRNQCQIPKTISCQQEYGSDYWCGDKAIWTKECQDKGSIINLPGGAYCQASDGKLYTSCVTCSEPSITVTSPNGGEVWEVGKSYNITWTSSLVDKVEIDLYKGNSLYKILASVPSDATNNTYSWTIPSDISPGDDYKIGVLLSAGCRTSADRGLYCVYPAKVVIDLSDNYFRIVEGCLQHGESSKDSKAKCCDNLALKEDLWSLSSRQLFTCCQATECAQDGVCVAAGKEFPAWNKKCENGKLVNLIECTDSDKGLNYYEKGKCIDGLQAPETNPLWDFCGTDGTTLNEVYCGQRYTKTELQCNYATFKCLYGCKDGACVREAPQNDPVSGTLSVSSARVKVGEKIILTVTGKDNDGLQKLWAYYHWKWHSASVQGTDFSYDFTFSESRPGVYYYRGYIFGTKLDGSLDRTWAEPRTIRVSVTRDEQVLNLEDLSSMLASIQVAIQDLFEALKNLKKE